MTFVNTHIQTYICMHRCQRKEPFLSNGLRRHLWPRLPTVYESSYWESQLATSSLSCHLYPCYHIHSSSSLPIRGPHLLPAHTAKAPGRVSGSLQVLALASHCSSLGPFLLTICLLLPEWRFEFPFHLSTGLVGAEGVG